MTSLCQGPVWPRAPALQIARLCLRGGEGEYGDVLDTCQMGIEGLYAPRESARRFFFFRVSNVVKSGDSRGAALRHEPWVPGDDMLWL